MASLYRQIFKANMLIGGAQAVNLLVGVLRLKVLAVILGPAGVGLVGMYQSATGLIGTLSGLGIGQSGVRQIAEAVSTGDQSKISRTVATLRITSLLCGVAGMLGVLLSCKLLSRATFGNLQSTVSFALISVTLLLGSVSAGQIALLQGMRRLKELAMAQVSGAVLGTLGGVACIFFLRDRGVVPFLIAVSAFAALMSWWYAKRAPVQTERLHLGEALSEARSLLTMGVAFMITGLLFALVAYVVRIVISRELGIGAVGLYQAASAVSSVYVSLILQAMAADFYPRLTGAANDNAAVNRMVNEQSEVGLLIALPGIVATLALAPWVLQVLYSSKFEEATPLIRWMIVGCGLRILSWPIGYIQVAKGKSHVFIFTETANSIIHVCLQFVCIRLWGLVGSGVAFVLHNVAHMSISFIVGRGLSGFNWTKSTLQMLFVFIFAVTVTMWAVQSLPSGPGTAVGLILTLIAGGWSARALQRLLRIDVKGILALLGKRLSERFD